LISKNDPDIVYKLQGWYQKLTGSDTKGEKSAIGGGNAAPKTETKKSYSVGGKSYSHDALIKMGYTEDEIQQAIKLGTIK